jgi:aldehyde:ferredoxin oxidoreductase
MNEPARTGSQKGAVSKLDTMLPEYYRVRGWSPEGVPTAETRARLGV